MVIETEIIDFDGHELLIRNATTADAEMLIEYLKIINSETRFLRLEPEEIKYTAEQECDFIQNCNSSKTNIMLLAFLDGEYIGNCSYAVNNVSRECHRATLGIALYHKYTGKGLGRVLIEKLCDIARENGIEQMELEVVAQNIHAISLYKKLGFCVCGTFPSANKYKDGTYSDSYFMMKKL